MKEPIWTLITKSTILKRFLVVDNITKVTRIYYE